MYLDECMKNIDDTIPIYLYVNTRVVFQLIKNPTKEKSMNTEMACCDKLEMGLRSKDLS